MSSENILLVDLKNIIYETFCRFPGGGGFPCPVKYARAVREATERMDNTDNTDNSVIRCPWADSAKPDYVAYHDREWGVPVRDDRRMFEFLVLESAQAGLSWYTILRKRANYRRAFDRFDPQAVARYDEARIAALLADPGIVRNRAKIRSAVTNARCFLAVTERFGRFVDYIWRFVDGRPVVNAFETMDQVPAFTPVAAALSRDLRQRGFTFVGPTICYALMQATGMVNDHLVACFRRAEILAVPE